MHIQLKYLFPVGIFASLGAPIFLGMSALISNLLNDRAINIISIMLYGFTAWGFSLVITEAVVLSVIAISLLFRKNEINILLIGGMLLGLALIWIIAKDGVEYLIKHWFVIIATLSNFLLFFLISLQLKNQR